MVHVSNSEGRRKMLAYSVQTESSFNTILSRNLRKDDIISTLHHRIINCSDGTANQTNIDINSLGEEVRNNSQEDSSSADIMMTPNVVSDSLSISNNPVEDNNYNVNNNPSALHTTDNNSNTPATTEELIDNSGISRRFGKLQSSFTTTSVKDESDQVIRVNRGSPNILSHDFEEMDESEKLDCGDPGSESRVFHTIEVAGTLTKIPPTYKSLGLSAATATKLRSENSTPSATDSLHQQAKLNNFPKNSKQIGLKRVSFGNSVVETLVYDSPVTEANKIKAESSNSDSEGCIIKGTSKEADQNDSIDKDFPLPGGSTGGSRPPSRVRVTFFESEKPLAVSSPESDILDFDFSNMAQLGSPDTADGAHNYTQQMSGEIGWENPFRPDGDLSKEADQIVELIKEGKPINDETLRSKSPSMNETMNSTSHSNYGSAPRKGTNGSTVNGSGSLEVQHGVAPATQGGTVEHVVLKKKKGCCVIQ